MADRLTTTQAAEMAGVKPASFRSMATRARKRGVELLAPTKTWPDSRTPLWDADAVRAHMAERPGRGRWGRED